MTAENSPIVSGVLYVLEGLLLTGIVATVAMFFDIRGDVREIKGLLNHPDNGVTAKAKATDVKVDKLTERMGKIETEHTALARHVGYLES